MRIITLLTLGLLAQVLLANQGGPDSFGYRFVDNLDGDTAGYHWVELCGDEFAEDGPTGDDVASPISWSFDFPFYGGFYTSAFVSTNGLIQFLSANNSYINPCPLDFPGNWGPQIAPFWKDLLAIHNGNCDQEFSGSWIWFRDFGDRIVIEWRNQSYEPDRDWVMPFQVTLYATGEILFAYRADWRIWRGYPNGETIGILGLLDEEHLTYRCPGLGIPAIAGGRAVRYYLPDCEPVDDLRVQIVQVGALWRSRLSWSIWWEAHPVIIYSTDMINHDGDPNHGNDSQWSALITTSGDSVTAEWRAWVDMRPIATYRCYVVYRRCQ